MEPWVYSAKSVEYTSAVGDRRGVDKIYYCIDRILTCSYVVFPSTIRGERQLEDIWPLDAGCRYGESPFAYAYP